MIKSIAVIGAGRIAHSIIPALVKSGYNIEIVISKKLSSAKNLSQKNSVKRFSTSLKSIPQNINTYLLTVPDSEIKSTAKSLSKLKSDFKRNVVIHFSGIETIEPLKILSSKGALIGSVHIMASFPDKKVIALKGIRAAIESIDAKTKKILFNFSRKLRLVPAELKSEIKPYYHLAGVFASNYFTGNLFNAEELLKFSKFSKKEAKEIILSTTETTLNNFKQKNAATTLSGPIARADIDAIKKHISSLKKIKKENSQLPHNLLNSYLLQSLMLLNLVEKQNVGLSKKHRKIKTLLTKELKSN